MERLLSGGGSRIRCWRWLIHRIKRVPTQTPQFTIPGFKSQTHNEVLGDS